MGTVVREMWWISLIEADNRGSVMLEERAQMSSDRQWRAIII